MIPIYKTTRMEESVLALDASHERVMVRAIHYLENPIRIRVKKLESIRPFYARNDPAFDAEIAKWNEENGTLINYRPSWKREPVLPHNASLLCECPLSMDDIEAQTRDTSDLAVIYKPPTWRAHEETIFKKNPTATECKRFMQVLAAVKPEKEMALIAQSVGIPTSGTYAVADAALTDDFPDLFSIRKRSMRSATGRRYTTVIQLIPRIEPEDRSLLEMYRFIKTLPAMGHIHLARDNALAKGARFWKLALRALVRSGSVEQKAKIGFYFLDGLAPDYVKIQAEHDAAKGKLNRLIQEVEALPDFLQSQPSIAPE